MSLEYRLGGRKVSRDAWLKGLADEARAGAYQETQRRIERVVCSEHGERPVVTLERTPEGATFRIHGCCERLVEAAQRAAGAS